MYNVNVGFLSIKSKSNPRVQLVEAAEIKPVSIGIDRKAKTTSKLTVWPVEGIKQLYFIFENSK